MPLLTRKEHADGRACVLVATDFSETSRGALALGANMAKAADIRLQVIHIVDMMDGENPFKVFFDDPASLESQVHEDAYRKVQDQVASVVGEEHVDDVELTVKFGHPIDDIVGTGDHDDVVLIVLGTTGGGRFENAVFGSTAARVVREATKPVLMVPPDVKTSPAKSILAPVDFSECSRHSLAAAAEVARANGGEVLVFNAMTMPPLTPYYPAAPPPSPKLLQSLSKDRRQRVDQMIEDLGVSDTAHSIGVEHTEAIEDAILEVAEARKVDLICMGSHGRRGLERLLLGSTTEKVLRAAKLPVLVITE